MVGLDCIDCFVVDSVKHSWYDIGKQGNRIRFIVYCPDSFTVKRAGYVKCKLIICTLKCAIDFAKQKGTNVYDLGYTYPLFLCLKLSE